MVTRASSEIKEDTQSIGDLDCHQVTPDLHWVQANLALLESFSTICLKVDEQTETNDVHVKKRIRKGQKGSETPKGTTLRQKQKNREHKASSRANETLSKQKLRLTVERENRAQSRAKETIEERNKRLAIERERRALARANETPEERQKRLAVERSRRSLARAKETSPERHRRLAVERERRALARARETSPQRNKRLAHDRQRRAEARASEISETDEDHC